MFQTLHSKIDLNIEFFVSIVVGYGVVECVATFSIKKKKNISMTTYLSNENKW
jgi:hypothetical protein